ncbi:hypothetical protein M427DRAFT_219332 [Gonapodya prolifera JEL478]|uniref:Uncharacterized protein n=1 Tax=Gonapodya prolifera (strain JEL478) TaxID=1344416 RepID=A0A138ZYP6_GONPJ|nr:hypothetical protein M427DRAFT_219332 [Gonapodya prolifera JEL478]|eukprot:KXS09632.1 hypothetical protein M427DRAFT_219332 [Gonapodya prolifera JEL478]
MVRKVQRFWYSWTRTFRRPVDAVIRCAETTCKKNLLVVHIVTTLSRKLIRFKCAQVTSKDNCSAMCKRPGVQLLPLLPFASSPCALPTTTFPRTAPASSPGPCTWPSPFPSLCSMFPTSSAAAPSTESPLSCSSSCSPNPLSLCPCPCPTVPVSPQGTPPHICESRSPIELGGEGEGGARWSRGSDGGDEPTGRRKRDQEGEGGVACMGIDVAPGGAAKDSVRGPSSSSEGGPGGVDAGSDSLRPPVRSGGGARAAVGDDEASRGDEEVEEAGGSARTGTGGGGVFVTPAVTGTGRSGTVCGAGGCE